MTSAFQSSFSRVIQHSSSPPLSSEHTPPCYTLLSGTAAVREVLICGAVVSLPLDEGYSEYFSIITGVRQGCILSLLLFLMVVDYVMRKTLEGAELGVNWREHGKLTDLDFVDDLALLEESTDHLQQLTTKLS